MTERMEAGYSFRVCKGNVGLYRSLLYGAVRCSSLSSISPYHPRARIWTYTVASTDMAASDKENSSQAIHLISRPTTTYFLAACLFAVSRKEATAPLENV